MARAGVTRRCSSVGDTALTHDSSAFLTIETNARLVASALNIGDINCVRKHLSAIKGGRLASRVKRSVTLVYSDVSTNSAEGNSGVAAVALTLPASIGREVAENANCCDRTALPSPSRSERRL